LTRSCCGEQFQFDWHIFDKNVVGDKNFFVCSPFRHPIPAAVASKHIAAAPARGRRESHKTGTDPPVEIYQKYANQTGTALKPRLQPGLTRSLKTETEPQKPRLQPGLTRSLKTETEPQDLAAHWPRLKLERASPMKWCFVVDMLVQTFAKCVTICLNNMQTESEAKRRGKTGVTADRDKIEFRLFNSSSIFNITLREELLSLPIWMRHPLPSVCAQSCDASLGSG